jgi:hypothetical protein
VGRCRRTCLSSVDGAGYPADSAVAEIVHIDDDGVVLLRVLPGTVEANRTLLDPLSSRS